MGLGLTNVARAAHVKGTHSLRDGGFDPFSSSILPRKCGSLLSTAGGLQGFMLFVRTHSDQSTGSRRARGGTGSQTRTDGAIFGGELDLDDLVFSVVDGGSPTAAGMPFRTGGRVVLPVNAKLTYIDAVIGVGLPFHIRTPRSNHFNTILLLTRDQDWCGDISRVEQVLAWGECRFLKICVDRFGHHLISRRSRGRCDMGDEMGMILITGFGQMDFVPGPPCLALFAVACFLIVGRIDEESRWSNIVIASPTDVTIHPAVILDPNAAQNLDSRDLTQ